jgi:hypothetical protein
MVAIFVERAREREYKECAGFGMLFPVFRPFISVIRELFP